MSSKRKSIYALSEERAGQQPPEYIAAMQKRQAEAREAEEAARAAQQEADEKATAAKNTIARNLKEGVALEYSLYAAIDAIGRLTGDAEWMEACTEQLNAIYGDTLQQSLLIDPIRVQIERLAQKETETKASLIKRLQKEVKALDEIRAAQNDLLTLLEKETSE